MPNQKISELTTATNPSVSDVLPIVNGGTTKKITAASLLTNSLSATMVSVSALKVNNNVFFRAQGGAIAIGDRGTGQTIIDSGACFSEHAWNVFLGFCAGKGVSKGVYGGMPSCNIAIGHKAGYRLGGDDDPSCAGRVNVNSRNTIIGNNAGQYLCAGGFYASVKNVILGDYAFQTAKSKTCQNVIIGYKAASYVCDGSDNVFIGYRATCDAGPRNLCRNTVIGACAGRGLSCNSTGNIAIGALSRVGVPSGYYGSAVISNAIAIGNYACAQSCHSVALGSSAKAYLRGDVVVGFNSKSRYSGGHMTIIGSCNCFSNSNIGSKLSGAIVIGSCNRDISTTFVLGSPVFPLSARPDTTLAGQVSSLFVTINGENRRIPILI
jgi:hypothetical protein